MGIGYRVRRLRRSLAGALCLLLAAGTVAAAQDRQPAGTRIGSPVTVTFDVEGAEDTLTATSDIPFIVIEPLRTNADLTILRQAAKAGSGTTTLIATVSYATDPEAASPRMFEIQDPAPLSGAARPAAPRTVALVPGRGFLPGETIFFHLRDAGINHRPDVAETVLVRFTTEAGDLEVFRLTASGLDSPDFYGYAPTVALADLRRGDGRLAVAGNQTVEATYEDPFDRTDMRLSVAVIDPAMRVFDAVTGAALDGATIRVVRDPSGEAAPVYGIDGTELLVGAVVSGRGVMDAGGQAYPARTGEARLPYLEPGRYRIEIDPPPGYVFPSGRSAAEIAAAPGRRLRDGAWGGVFEIEGGGPPVFDVPLDPRRSLVVDLTASRTDLALGDTLRLVATVRNEHDEPTADLVLDQTLPPGLRWIPGSATIDGRAADDPGGAAEAPRVGLGVLAPGESREVAFAVRVGAGARIGMGEATARAAAPLGFRSNTARAALTVRDPFRRDESTVLGAVVAGACGEAGQGVRARLLTETGIAIETDREGRFRIEGLSAGRHVLRLDETSLRPGLSLRACPGDLRPGDRPHARLIDARGGMIRNVVFRLHDSTPRPETPAPAADPAPLSAPAPSVGVATSGAAHPDSAPPAPARPAAPPPKTDYASEDLTAFEGLTLVYPAEGATLTRPLFDLGVAYPFGHTLEVRIDGAPADEDRYEGVIGNKDARIALRRWRGLETPEGPVRIEIVMRDKAGEEAGRIERRFGDAAAPAPPARAEAGPPEPSARPQRTGPPPALPLARDIAADDLADLPQEVAILYPDDRQPVAGSAFDLGILVPFGTKIAVTLDGAPVDAARSARSLVNRRARLSLRRWSRLPAGEGALRVVTTARDGTERVIDYAIPRAEADADAVTVEARAVPAGPEPTVPSGDDTPAVPPSVVPQDATAADLDGLPKTLQFLYPPDEASLPDPSLRLGIAHPLGTRLGVSVDGIALNDRTAEKGFVNRKARLSLKRWRGVDLADGATVIEARTLAPDGTVLETVTRRVHYVTEPADATFLPGESTLVADGETPPVIAVRLTDAGGRPLHEGRRVPATLAPPYRSATSFDRFEEDPLAASRSTRATLIVGENGIARLALHPTTRSGEADLRVETEGGETRLRPWLAPAPRPWIVVGLAEGTAGYATVSGNMESADRAGLEEGTFTDGRLAFYAKGAIRGDWLLTLAYDSDADFDEGAVRDRIDPTAYYPVYGDASLRSDTALSRYPLYVRLERGQFYALFGDYETGLNRTELGAYTRTLSGFKTAYEGERLSVVAFAAEADRQFRRVERQASRGIGPYETGGAVARNSETVTLVTRERDRLDTVLEETVLAPDLDYDIDYDTGTVFLRLPPEPVDADFNPRFVVIEYEREAADPGTITAGGRAALRALDGRVEVGATVVHEEGGAMDASGDLVALDVTVRATDDLEIEAEIAASRTEEDGETREGTAFRAEARYARETWDARVYVHQSDADFGVANQSVGRAGRRVVGAELRASLPDPLTGADGERPVMLDLTARASHDRALTGSARRDAAEIALSRPVELEGWGRGHVAVGYRGERDRTDEGETGTTHRITGEVGTSILGGRATLSLAREQTVATTGATTPDATRATLRAALTDRIEGTVGVEVFDDRLSDANMTATIRAKAWKGAVIRAGASGTGAGDRINASLGVQQDIEITEALSATLTATRTQPLAGADSPVARTLFRDAAAEATTALSAGASYAANGWKASVRLDSVHTEESDRLDARAAVLHDTANGLTLAAAAEAGTARRNGGTETTYGATLAGAWRSDDNRTSLLQRLDADIDADGTLSAIHSLAVAHDLTARLSLAGVHALRFAEGAEGQKPSVMQFVGGDLYYRVRENWRLGLHGDALTAFDFDEARFAFGASVGYSPRPGMLLSLGYNLDGFDDADFADENHTRQGVYLRFSLAFDETDIGALLPGFVTSLAGRGSAR